MVGETSVRAARQCDWGIEPESLATYGVEVWQLHEGVVVEIGCPAGGRLDDLRAQLVLHIGVQRELMEDPRQRVRGGVHAGKNEGPVVQMSSCVAPGWT